MLETKVDSKVPGKAVDVAVCPSPTCTALVPARLYHHDFTDWSATRMQSFREQTYRIVGANIQQSRASSLRSIPTWLLKSGFEHSHIPGCSLLHDPESGSSACQEHSVDPKKPQIVAQTDKLTSSQSVDEAVDDTDLVNWEELAYSDDEWAGLAWELEETWGDSDWELHETWDIDDIRDTDTFDTVTKNEALNEW
jgi:hypothetical protein